MTVELWIRPSANQGPYGALVSNLNGCRPGDVTAGFEFGLIPSNLPTFTFFVEVPRPGGGSQDLTFEDGPALQPDVWHHVALVFEGRMGPLADTLWVYADGFVMGTYDHVGIGMSVNARYLTFGQRAGCVSDDYRGDMEAARVYQRALTFEELAAAPDLRQAP